VGPGKRWTVDVGSPTLDTKIGSVPVGGMRRQFDDSATWPVASPGSRSVAGFDCATGPKAGRVIFRM
jgi:hypothetical protein